MATHSAVAASGSRVSRVGQLIIERSLSTIASSREALSQAISTLKSVPAPTCATSNRTQRPGRTSACDVMKLVLTSSGIENRSIALPPANRPVLAPTVAATASGAIAASAIWIACDAPLIHPTNSLAFAVHAAATRLASRLGMLGCTRRPELQVLKLLLAFGDFGFT
jgi:hypothetical protein